MIIGYLFFCLFYKLFRHFHVDSTWSFCYFLATNGVVLAVEKKHKSQLYDEHSIHRIEMVTKNIGMVYSGMGPDFRY